jgi:hypothetical protein
MFCAEAACARTNMPCVPLFSLSRVVRLMRYEARPRDSDALSSRLAPLRVRRDLRLANTSVRMPIQ